MSILELKLLQFSFKGASNSQCETESSVVGIQEPQLRIESQGRQTFTRASPFISPAKMNLTRCLWRPGVILHVAQACVLVSLGYYNKSPPTEWLINSTHFCLTVLEAASLRSWCWQGWILVRSLFWVTDSHLLIVSTHGGKRVSQPLPIKALIPSPDALIPPLKAPPPNTVTWGSDFTIWFWGTHSVHDTWSPAPHPDFSVQHQCLCRETMSSSLLVSQWWLDSGGHL